VYLDFLLPPMRAGITAYWRGGSYRLHRTGAAETALQLNGNSGGVLHQFLRDDLVSFGGVRKMKSNVIVKKTEGKTGNMTERERAFALAGKLVKLALPTLKERQEFMALLERAKEKALAAK
jgi:hypothetical protein